MYNEKVSKENQNNIEEIKQIKLILTAFIVIFLKIT